MRLGRGMKDLVFNAVGKEEIRVNKGSFIIAVELKGTSSEEVDQMIEVNKLGKWKVGCYHPGKKNIVFGVIKGIDKSIDIEELKKGKLR